MLVSATEMLKKAKAGHYAVGQFNINNLEWTKSILLTAKELRSPVILGVSEGAGKYMGGYDVVVGMVNGLLKDLDIDVPVALHLDHGSFEGCYKCIEAGFSSIMFDGSHYPIAENVEKTTELVKAAHSKVVPSVVRKTALSVWASALILRSVSLSLIWVLTSWQQVSVTFMVNTPLTGRA